MTLLNKYCFCYQRVVLNLTSYEYINTVPTRVSKHFCIIGGFGRMNLPIIPYNIIVFETFWSQAGSDIRNGDLEPGLNFF